MLPGVVVNRARLRMWSLGAALAAIAAVAIYLETRPATTSNPSPRPLHVYCAAALRPVMQAIAVDYERETGIHIVFDFGDSGAMLGNASVRPDGDLFLPADDSFVRIAEERGLVAATMPLARMRAVILTRPRNPHHITNFDDLLKPDVKLGIANPDHAAIGKVVRDHLRTLEKWDNFAARLFVQHTNVTDSANAVQLGSTDAAVVWDVVAVNYPELFVVRVPELDGAVGKVELAVLKSSPDANAANRFASFIAASDRGLSQFRKAGFADMESTQPWADTGSGP
jgi:molybdate transport system substrate-binding protein